MKYIVLSALSLLLVVNTVVNSHSIPLYELSPANINNEPNADNLAELALSLGLTTLVDAAKKVDIASVLENAPALTLFGPTNEAFGRVPAPVRPLLANDTLLRMLLLFHVVKGNVYSKEIKNELLVPSIIDSKPKFNIRFNIYETPKGEVVTAQCCQIIKVDQMASNGVLHVLNNVMIPANDTIANIVTTYSQYYSTLRTALVKAGLDKVLQGEGPFTVFAPINSAFAKIPPAKLKKILSDMTLLTKVLKYHVVAGTQCSAGLYDKQKVATLEGSEVEVHFAPGTVTINDARVLYVDASATNGVIHAIDTVLIPPDLEI